MMRWWQCEDCDVRWREQMKVPCWSCGKEPIKNGFAPVITSQFGSDGMSMSGQYGF